MAERVYNYVCNLRINYFCNLFKLQIVLIPVPNASKNKRSKIKKKVKWKEWIQICQQKEESSDDRSLGCTRTKRNFLVNEGARNLDIEGN